MRAIVLRLEAPLMSFGTVVVDQLVGTGDFPGRSQIAGMLANALGYDHADHAETSSLQSRIRHAVRCDVPGRRLIDYATVDLTQPGMQAAWTTRGEVEKRGGIAETHQRWVTYIADASYTVALALAEGEGPSIEAVAQALERPARPLFIGRKCCIPSRSMFVDIVEQPVRRGLPDALRAAMETAARAGRASREGEMRAWWPYDGGMVPSGTRVVYAADERDWRTGLIGGRRGYLEGMIDPAGV